MAKNNDKIKMRDQNGVMTTKYMKRSLKDRTTKISDNLGPVMISGIEHDIAGADIPGLTSVARVMAKDKSYLDSRIHQVFSPFSHIKQMVALNQEGYLSYSNYTPVERKSQDVLNNFAKFGGTVNDILNNISVKTFDASSTSEQLFDHVKSQALWYHRTLTGVAQSERTLVDLYRRGVKNGFITMDIETLLDNDVFEIGFSNGNEHKSIILGLQQDRANFYREMVKDYTAGKLNPKDHFALRYLQRFNEIESEMEFVNGLHGYKIAGFNASKAIDPDTIKELDPAKIESAITRLEAIHTQYQQDKVKWNGFDVTRAEKSILEQFEKVNGTNRSVLSGHNSIRFDMPKVAHMLRNGSEGAKQAFNAIFGGSLNGIAHLDTLALFQSKLASVVPQLRNYTGDKRGINKMQTIESILGINSNIAPHTGVGDAIAQHAVLINSSIKDSVLSHSPTPKDFGLGSVFTVTRGNMGSSNPFNFWHDGNTGRTFFNEGIMLDHNGAIQNSQTIGVRKGASYVVTDIGNFGNLDMDLADKLGYNGARNSLKYMTVQQVGGDLGQSFTFVGSTDELSEMVSYHTELNGSTNNIKVAKDAIEGNVEALKKSISGFNDSSMKVANQEAAATYIENMTFNKLSKIHTFIEEMDKRIAANGINVMDVVQSTSGDKQLSAEFMEAFNRNLSEMMSDTAFMDGMFDYSRYDRFKNAVNTHNPYGSLNLRHSALYLYSNRTAYKSAYEVASSTVGNLNKSSQSVFRDKIARQSVTSAFTIMGNAVGMSGSSFMGYSTSPSRKPDSVFTIDVTGMLSNKDRKSGKVAFLDIDLAKPDSAENIPRRLAEITGRSDEPVRLMSELENIINSNFGMGNLLKSAKGSTEDARAQNVFQGLQRLRAVIPKAGSSVVGGPKKIDVSKANMNAVIHPMKQDELTKKILKDMPTVFSSKINPSVDSDAVIDKFAEKRLFGNLFSNGILHRNKDGVISANVNKLRDFYGEDAQYVGNELLRSLENTKTILKQVQLAVSKSSDASLEIDDITGKVTLYGQTTDDVVDITSKLFTGNVDKKTGAVYLGLGGQKMSLMQQFLNTTSYTNKEALGGLGQTIYRNPMLGNVTDIIKRQIEAKVGSGAISMKVDRLFFEFNSLFRSDNIGSFVIAGTKRQDSTLNTGLRIEGLFDRIRYLYQTNNTDYNFTSLFGNADKRGVSNIAVEALREFIEADGAVGTGELYYGTKVDLLNKLRQDTPGVLKMFAGLDDKVLGTILSDNDDTRQDDIAKFRDLVNMNINIGNGKGLGKGIVSLSTRSVDPILGMGTDKRTIQSTIGRTHNIDDDVFNRVVNGEGPQSSKYTRGMHVEYQGALLNRKNAITGMTMQMTQRTYRDTLKKVRDDLGRGIDAKIKSVFGEDAVNEVSQMYAFLGENGSILNPRLNNMYGKTSRQTFDLASAANLDKLKAEGKTKVARFMAEVEELTKLSIQRSDDFYNITSFGGNRIVRKGEEFAATELHNGAVNMVRAQRLSMMSAKYFDSYGNELSENAINEMLKNKEVTKRIDYNRLNGELSLNEAIELELKNAGIKKKLVLDDILFDTTRKGILDAEKTQSRWGISRIGSLDKGVKTVFDKLGLGSYEFAILGNEFLDVDANGRMSNLRKLYDAMPGTRGDFDSVMKAALKSAGIESESALSQRMWKERTYIFDEITKGIAKEFDIKNFTLDGFIGISGTITESAKHSAAGYSSESGQILFGINNYIAEAINRGESLEQISMTLGEYIKNSDGESAVRIANIQGPDGKFTPERRINIDARDMHIVKADEFAEKIHSYDGKPSVIYGTQTYSSAHDHIIDSMQIGNSKEGMKYTSRVRSVTQRQRWSQDKLSDTYKIYQKSGLTDLFKKEFESVLENPDFGNDEAPILKKELEGKSIQSAALDFMDENVMAGNGKLLIENGEMNASERQKLINEGYSPELIDKYNKSYSARFKDVGVDHFRTDYAAKTSIDAAKFNELSTIEQEAKMAEMSHFRKVHYADISNIFGSQNEMSVAGQPGINMPTIIDLGESNTLHRDINGRSQRYIAVGAETPSQIGSHEMYSDTRKAMYSLGKIMNTESGAPTEKDIQRASRAVERIVKSEVAAASTKEGLVNEQRSGYIAGSANFKANIIDLNTDDPLLKRALLGKDTSGEYTTLTKRVSDGIGQSANVTFVGEDFFVNNVFTEDFKKNFGNLVSQEEMFEMAETRGAIGITQRQPMEYMLSSTPSQIYLQRGLKSGDARWSLAASIGAKADQDGDNIQSALSNGMATITDSEGNKVARMRVNQLQINLLNDKGYNIQLDDPDRFKNLEVARDQFAADPLNMIINRFENGEDESLEKLIEKHRASITGTSIGNRTYTQADFSGLTQETIDLKFNEFMDMMGSDADSYKDNDIDFYNKHKEKIDNLLINSTNEDLKLSVASKIHGARQAEEIQSLTSRAKAGIIGNEVYLLDQISDIAAHTGRINTYDQEVIKLTSTHIAETALAGKNSVDIGFEFGNFRDSLRAMYRGDGSAQLLVELDKLNLGKEFGKILSENSGYNLEDYFTVTGRNEKGEAISWGLSDKGKESFTKIVSSGERISKEVLSTLRDTTPIDVYNTDIDHVTRFIKDIQTGSVRQDIDNKSLEAFAEWMEESTGQKFTSESMYIKQGYSTALDKTVTSNASLDDMAFTSRMMDQDSMGVGEMMRSSFSGLKKSVFSSKGAVGMLGFAGATMMAGIMGGAPTSPQPTHDQARGISSDQAIYQMPNSIENGKQRVNQGYVINMNVSSSKGRAFAEDAIRQAFEQQKLNGDIRMTMNVKDQTSQFSNRDIAGYLSSML